MNLTTIYNRYFLPIGLLAGAIIGAGIFALPFVFAQSGLLLGFFYLALGSAAYTSIHLLCADILFRSDGEHRFIGFARMYLGRFAAFISFFMTVCEMILVLTIYLLLATRFGTLFGASLGQPTLLIFWALGSFCIFFRLRLLAILESWITVFMIVIVALLFVFGLSHNPSLTYFFATPRIPYLFLPFAPVLFALSGRVALPSLVAYLRRKNAERFVFRRVIIWGTIIPAIVYGVFVVGVLALTPHPSDDAISGLQNVLPLPFVAALGVFGLLSLFSSYVVVGLDVYHIFDYDLTITRWLRMLLIIILPIGLYFAGAQQFVPLVRVTGGVFLALEGVFVALMWARMNAERVRVPGLFSPRLGYALVVFSLIVFSTAFVVSL